MSNRTQQKSHIRSNSESISMKEDYQIKSKKIHKTQLNKSSFTYKNLPKMLGNNFVKYAIKNQIVLSDKARFIIEKKNKIGQTSFEIEDLRNLCSNNNQDKEAFQIYLKKQFFLDLIHSTKVEHPLNYASGISNYYAASEQPEKMISSLLMSKFCQN